MRRPTWAPRNEDIESVRSHRSWGPLAVVATVLVLALLTAGCARPGIPAEAGVDDAAAANQAAATTGPTIRPTAEASVPPPSAVATEPPVTVAPVMSAPASQPPLAMPDLAAIDNLLEELDAALGADATADTEEGSAP